MLGKFQVAFILLFVACGAMADGYSHPVVMTGVTQMADTAELHFDPAPAHTGKLIVLGDHSKTPPQSYPFVYNLPAPQRTEVDPPVKLDFTNKQKLTLLCDPRSDNCIATGYLTFGETTFSILWKVTQR
jgi:hypothetical protein